MYDRRHSSVAAIHFQFRAITAALPFDGRQLHLRGIGNHGGLRIVEPDRDVEGAAVTGIQLPSACPARA